MWLLQIRRNMGSIDKYEWKTRLNIHDSQTIDSLDLVLHLQS
jgi:hypothetical protein